MEIDIRQSGATTIDAIRYSNNQVVVGSPASDNISIRDSNNAELVVCRKGNIDQLIAALQTAKRVW